MKIKQLLYCFLFLIFFSCNSEKKTVCIIDQLQSPKTTFALTDLKEALEGAGYSISKTTGETKVKIILDNTLKAQQYKIHKTNKQTITLTTGDDLGAMYGILDLAEQINITQKIETIEEKDESPFIEKRGIKMNVALDGRLPSYDDTGDAAQNNIAEMWNIEFWKEYLDDLARHRYNVLSLWSKHPFPALCKLKNYPGAAMDDVYMYNKPITWDMHRDWRNVEIPDDSNWRKIKSMTIDQKIDFWKNVMEHAHNRGIDVIWFTWNIFISPGTGEIKDPKSEKAITYMRDAVKEMVETYPHLSGFGVTAGERMGMTVGKYSAPAWMYETYGKGVIEATKKTPNRPFRFIFRRHHAFLETIQNDFASKFPGKVETSYKYSVARMYSSARPPIFEREYLPDVKKYNFKCWMNLRNDDVFSFRWGDPDFVREYLKGFMKHGVVPGFYMGSDGYLWGREFTSKNKELSGELEIKKHWYRYMLWGRLAFNPELKDAHLQNILGYRFPEVSSKSLFETWRLASKVFPIVCNFHWKASDAMWSVEGCMDQYKGFQTIRDFIDCYTLENDRLQNITDYVIDLKANKKSDLKSPFETAEKLREISKQVQNYLDEIRSGGKNLSSTTEATLNDLECYALYGEYYAGKIAGATYLHMYENLNDTKKESYKLKALEETKLASEAWKKLANVADGLYKTQLLARTRELDWVKNIKYVEEDIEIVKASKGKEAKVAKLFYAGEAKIEKSQRLKLARFFESKGYKVEEYQGWKTEQYASGFMVVFSAKGGLVSQFFTSRGGVYPSSFESEGVIINELHHKTWVIGKDAKHANLGVDKLISKLEKRL